METVKQIKLSKDDFIIEAQNSSLKLKYVVKNDKYVVDISNMNLITATKVAILCSTYCFLKDFKKKICWIVKDDEISKAISILRLRNVEQMLVSNRLELAS